MYLEREDKVTNKFGFLARFELLQDLASIVISGIKPAIVHNIEKYHALKKVHYLTAIEDIEGDYLEFGVFTGSSFCHSIRCNKKLSSLNENIIRTRFFGFDSFEGFGEINKEEQHPFYTDDNFNTSYEKVKKRVSKVSREDRFKLVQGFFSESLKEGISAFGIEKTKILFIDSDTYSSARDAFNFVLPTIQEGSYVILDDYYSYKGNRSLGVKKAFDEFVTKGNLEVRRVFTYGMGGAVYVVSAINK